MKLKTHTVHLKGERITLSPLTEDDWDILLEWNSDPEILYYSEGNDIESYSLKQIQDIYRGVSQNAFCFIIEYEGQPIGEGWLQKMNIIRICAEHPDQDVRRIDLMIGEKSLWGKGMGTDTIKTLIKLGFEQEKADIIYGLVDDFNKRSIKAFEKAGFTQVC